MSTERRIRYWRRHLFCDVGLFLVICACGFIAAHFVARTLVYPGYLKVVVLHTENGFAKLTRKRFLYSLEKISEMLSVCLSIKNEFLKISVLILLDYSFCWTKTCQEIDISISFLNGKIIDIVLTNY